LVLVNQPFIKLVLVQTQIGFSKSADNEFPWSTGL